MAPDAHKRRRGWTQTDAARRRGVTQPRVSGLMRGTIALFGLGALVNTAMAVSCRRSRSARPGICCQTGRSAQHRRCSNIILRR